MKKNFQQKFIDLSKFLTAYHDIIDVEFLKHYPHPFPQFIHNWCGELQSWDFKKLAEFESNPHEDHVSDISFKQFIKSIRELTQVEKSFQPETKLPKPFARKINNKKKHEIQSLKTLIDKMPGSETIIDIGGGSGYLSCALLSDTEKNSLCIDNDESLQISGIKRIEKWYPEIKNQIKFVTTCFDESELLNEKFENNKTLLIGLHCCGLLSTAIIKFAVKNKIGELINFGCCYHKLKDEYNISSLSKEKQIGIKFSQNALFLAERSAAYITEQELRKRFEVKRYRYTLHYFLHDYFNLPFYGIGNTCAQDYESDFATYAKKYHKGTELELISNGRLNEFYQDNSIQEKVRLNFYADLIRLQFGRAIELYILLDRAIYLEENGRSVQLIEFFDRSISPRNIMIKC